MSNTKRKLLISATIFTIVTSVSNARAAGGAESYSPLMLVAYSDAPAGEDIVRGNYQAAVRTLQRQLRWFDDVYTGAVETNRCVAYSATKQWQAARAACDAALSQAQQDDGESSAAALISGHYRSRLYATALGFSNRAVFEWLSGDRVAAQRDLRQAQLIEPSADFVARNLAVVRSLTTERAHPIEGAAASSR